MKSYSEIEANAYKKAEMRIQERKHRRAVILRSLAVGVGAAAVLGVGLTTFALRPPKKPTPSQSGIIVETETTSAETSTTQTSLCTTASKTTGVKQTTSAKQATTTAVSTAAALSSARQTETTALVTTSAARTTMAAVKTTAAAATSTASSTIQTAAAITTGANIATNELPVVSTEHIPWKRVVFGENKTYNICSRDNEQITAAAQYIGEYYGEGTLMIDDEQSACKLYTYKDFSPSYVCAIKETEDSEPKLYTSFVESDTLGELLEATDFENTVVIKEAYKGFIEPYSVPFEKTPTMSDLMKALSNTSLEKCDITLMNTRSYTLEVEIPELGIEYGKIDILRSPGELSKSGYISLTVFGTKNTYNVGTKKLDEFILTFDESFSPKIIIP